MRFSDVQSRGLMVLHESVYDLKDFLSSHPGGGDVLRPWLGRDGTAAFAQHHSKDFLNMAQKFCLGRIDASDPDWRRDVERQKSETAAATTTTNIKSVSASDARPALSSMLNAHDFRAVAERAMVPSAWAYYDSGANGEATLAENERVFDRIWLRPRVMVNVARVDTRTTLLGVPSPSPLYVTATALARLGHPDAEAAIVRACHAASDTIYMLPTLSSCSLDEMLGARAPNQPTWFQLYVNPDRRLTEAVVRKAEAGGCKAIFVTVDAPQLGRRERDMRHRATETANLQKGDASVKRDKGTSAALSSFIDPSFCWDDWPWLQSLTKLPLVLKGVQRADDAVLAVQRGCRAMVLSNHGGRQQDFARSGTEVLVEVVERLRKLKLRDKVQIFVDGGVRRGVDVFKLMCLGADGVGIGRPVLHALASYGQEGVEHLLQLFQDELSGCFAFCGVQNISQLNRSFVVLRDGFSKL